MNNSEKEPNISNGSRLGLVVLRWNNRFRSPRCRVALTLSAAILTFLFLLVHTGYKHSLTNPPSTIDDQISYDSLGWSLSQGNGFVFDAQGSFLEPYRKVGTANKIPHWEKQTTAYRPPLYPALLSFGNQIFGRQFWWGRGINFLCVALTAGLIVWTVARIAGPIPATLAGISYSILDWRVRDAARHLLTESLAGFLVAVLTFLLVIYAANPRYRTALLAGLIFGLSILARGIFVLWTPILGILLLFIHRKKWAGWCNARSFKLTGTFFAAAFVVCAPWIIRNCAVTGAFMPMGTLGGMELSAGYSDEAYALNGVWNNLRGTPFYQDLDLAEREGVEKEVAYAKNSTSRAIAWSVQNWYKLPILIGMKILNESVLELYSFTFIPALFGLLFLMRQKEGWVYSVIIVAALFSVALTWSVRGRFLIPILYVTHVCAAIGIWCTFLAITINRNQTASLVNEPPVSHNR